MPGMGISKNAWISVSKNEKENGTDLTIEHVAGLIDHQRNSFAQLTFSKCVEEEMHRTGFTNEANWCSLIRHFYRAVDEAGVSVEDRITWLLDMRGFLLTQYNPMKFPPPGGFVKDMPMAQFEGLLTNIDRRLQLYQQTQNGSYCHRAISSLDSESMFGSFQDLDPKGTGHLKADDIPTALGNVTCLFQLKHNINRGFSLSTTKRPKVYNDEPLMDERVLEDKEFDEGATAPSATSDMLSSNVIRARSHPFDRVERRKVHARRKSGKLSTLDCQAKGAQGYRYYHRLNEVKIFAHRRNRIPDKDIDSAVKKMES